MNKYLENTRSKILNNVLNIIFIEDSVNILITSSSGYENIFRSHVTKNELNRFEALLLVNIIRDQLLESNAYNDTIDVEIDLIFSILFGDYPIEFNYSLTGDPIDLDQKDEYIRGKKWYYSD